MKNYVARFCRTLGTLLQADVSLIEALGVTMRIFQSEQLQQEIQGIIDGVRQGRTVAEPLVTSRFFPPMVSQMIAVGEETSELDAMLLKVAAYYEKDIDIKVETLSSVIEPVVTNVPAKNVVGVKFKRQGKIYSFEAGDLALNPGDQVIVETDNGLTVATVASAVKETAFGESPANMKEDSAQGPLRRSKGGSRKPPYRKGRLRLLRKQNC